MKTVRASTISKFRILIQFAFFLAAPSLYNSSFTAVKNTFTLIGAGKPLEMNAFVIQLLLLLVYTLLFGRFFCGWACAFGAINDWVYHLSRVIFHKAGIKKIPKLPENVISILQWLKYVVLAGILVLCFLGRGSLISPNSPWTAFSLIRSGNFISLSGMHLSLILLGLLIIGMVFHERFFCQFLCPMGAVFSMLPNIPFFRLVRRSETCPPRCGACRKACPVNLLMEENSLKSGECIRCGRCSVICPKGNITTCGLLKGDELWLDGIKAIVLLALIIALQKM